MKVIGVCLHSEKTVLGYLPGTTVWPNVSGKQVIAHGPGQLVLAYAKKVEKVVVLGTKVELEAMGVPCTGFKLVSNEKQHRDTPVFDFKPWKLNPEKLGCKIAILAAKSQRDEK